MAHPNTALTDSEIQEALTQARRLIQAGVPVFTAPPCRPGCGLPAHPAGIHHYHLPKHWTQTIPAEVNLERWEPGWALAAIGGFGADFLDVDPRSGGDATAEGLISAGLWPRTFGRQRTPSGGWHDLITPTGQRKGVLSQGIDLQAGLGTERQGLGFVYLAPTVGVSKVTGELVPYRWETPPDTEALAEWRGQDESTEHVIHLMVEKRSTVPAQRQPEPAGPTADDPFMTPSMTGAAGHSGAERSFTLAQAQDYLRPYLLRLQEAQVGTIEETANVAAAALSHFVPAFWSADQAYAFLADALAHTAYDPNRVGATWRAEKFMGVLNGSRPPADNWKATHRPEPPTAPVVAVEAAPGEENLTTLERLRRMLKTATEMAESPAPEPLVYGLLDMETESWLIGAPGSLKSFIALDIAGHVGAGRDWQGHRVRKSKVLYIAAEGVRGMVLRTRAWMKTHGDMEGVTFLPYPVKVKSHDGQWEALVQLAREGDGGEPYGMVIVDTQARVSVGLEENSATDIGILLDAVSALKRATGACVLVVHHTGRNGQDARGSSAIDGAQDTELKVVRAEPRSSLVCKIVQDKQKDMAEGDAGGLPLRLRVVDLGLDPVTGRDLSSLVVMSMDDPYEAAQGVDMVDVEPWRGRHPEDWTKAGGRVASQAKVKRRILQALADHAGMTGLTEAITRRVVKDRWEEPSATGWTDAWQAVKDLEGLVTNVGGERWAIDQAALEELKNGR
jgi:hypothetical protein